MPRKVFMGECLYLPTRGEMRRIWVLMFLVFLIGAAAGLLPLIQLALHLKNVVGN